MGRSGIGRGRGGIEQGWAFGAKGGRLARPDRASSRSSPASLSSICDHHASGRRPGRSWLRAALSLYESRSTFVMLPGAWPATRSTCAHASAPTDPTCAARVVPCAARDVLCRAGVAPCPAGVIRYSAWLIGYSACLIRCAACLIRCAACLIRYPACLIRYPAKVALCPACVALSPTSVAPCPASVPRCRSCGATDGSRPVARPAHGSLA